MIVLNIKKFVLGSFQSNCYILYKDFKAMIIDPGYESKALDSFLASNGLVVDIIYITHGHIDHVGGVNALKRKYPRSTVYAPRKDQYWYQKDPRKGLHEDVLIDVYVKEGDYVSFFDYLFKVIETPGHSYGSTCLYYHHILFSGDTLFKGSVGRTDLYLGSFDELEKSIKQKLYTLPDETIVYPGHGDETSILFERKYNYYVKGGSL